MPDYLWMGMVLCALVFALLSGRGDAAGAAALEGAAAAVKLCLETGGAICLWSGVLALLEEGGALGLLQRLLRPLLLRLFPEARENPALGTALTENLSANLLGLGNAATPAGIRAAKLLRSGERASDSLCRLTVLNSASLQLIPTTVCALRAAAGSEKPFAILPAVWGASLCALLAALAAEKLLRALWR